MADRPNILIVMTDHQRGDTVLPEHPCRTPNIQRLVDAGVTFAETHCTAPHCCPARASFFSGLYPSGHGVWNNICNAQRLSDGIGRDVRLWSGDLREAGYTLHYVGKWHVDTKTRPADHGFIEHTVGATGESFHGQSWDRVRRAAAEPEPTERGWGQLLQPGYPRPLRPGFGVQPDPENHPDYRRAGEAVEALDQLAGQDDPWALYVGFIGPHDPYFAPQEFLDLYELEDVPLPASYHDEMRDKPNIYRRMREQVFAQWGPQETRDAIRHFWAYCSWLDAQFGRIMDKLDATGQADNTLVLYCSDHGDYCGEHGLFAKGIPNFKSAYHVPAVVRWPADVVNPGRRVGGLVSLCDFAPTFLELAGVAPNRPMHGRSLAPFLRDEAPADWRDALLMQCNGVENYFTQRGVRTAEWHYNYNAFDYDELYDLRNDPHETRNLAGEPQYAEQVRRMCARMWRLCEQVGDTPGNSYLTVALAPVGPVAGARDAERDLP
ncbi:MAG: sulfatase-like hydrolase/transferase [Planctomycetota bacterium]